MTEQPWTVGESFEVQKQMLPTSQGCLGSTNFLGVEMFYKHSDLCKNPRDEL